MDVIVVRHGIAVDQEDALGHGLSDRDRPLSPKGRSRMKRVAQGLAQRAPGVVSLSTSPLLRAIETAEIVRKAYGDLEVTETPALLPQAEPQELAQFLSENGSGSPVAVIGHEPHLSRFVGWCLVGEAQTFLDLRKGAACLLRFEDSPGAAKGSLLWLVPPAMLRRL